jgi:hypothetical protein
VNAVDADAARMHREFVDIDKHAVIAHWHPSAQR